MENKKKKLKDYLTPNRTWSSSNSPTHWNTQKPSSSYSGYRPFNKNEHQSWRTKGNTVRSNAVSNKTYKKDSTDAETPNNIMDPNANETQDEKLTRGALAATPRSQELLADYRTFQGQADFTAKASERAFARQLYATDELAQSQRIKDKIAMYSAGVGSSGLTSQAMQDLGNRKARTVNELLVQRREKQLYFENQKELKGKEIWAKMMADESFKKNITPKPIGDEDNSIGLDVSTFDAIKKTYPKAKNKDLMAKLVKDTLMDSIKDEKTRNEFLKKYEDNYEQLAAPFLVKGAQLEMSINKRNGSIAYLNKKTGRTLVVGFKKNEYGNWAIEEIDKGIEENTLSNAYSQSDKILQAVKDNTNPKITGAGPNYSRINNWGPLMSVKLTDREMKLIQDPKTNRTLIDKAILNIARNGYSEYTRTNSVLSLSRTNDALKDLTNNPKANLYVIMKSIKELFASGGI